MRLIDADEFRRQILSFATGCHSEVLAVDTIMMLLAQAPTINPDDLRPHGWWEFTVPKPEMIGYFQCSQCAFCNGIRKSNYCSNCGARMDRKENEDA